MSMLTAMKDRLWPFADLQPAVNGCLLPTQLGHSIFRNYCSSCVSLKLCSKQADSLRDMQFA